MRQIHSIAILAGLWGNGIASAQQIDIPQEREQARKRIRAHRVETPPMMDGLVREPVWQVIDPADGFIQQEPNEGSIATEQTEAALHMNPIHLKGQFSGRELKFTSSEVASGPTV